MTKVPTRSPTHEDIEPRRLASMGLELEDIASDDQVTLKDLVELSEDRGRPASHYIAAIPLATEIKLAGDRALKLKVCVGTCQRYGALDVVDAVIENRLAVDLVPVECLDRCDQGPACELHGPDGQLVLAPATVGSISEAVGELSR